MSKKLVLVYDGDCPFCSLYVQYVRIQDAAGGLELVNARNGGQLTESIKDRGLDLNEGMVLVMDGKYYFGSDCVNRLALMSTRNGWFNRLNAFIFSYPALSNVLYPCLKFGRRITLRLLGRRKIE